MEETNPTFSSIPAQGYFVDYSPKASNNPGYDHVFCGTHQIEGANCPNCKKPLLRLLSLDLSDPCLHLTPAPFTELPLFFCWTCNLAQSPFYYRINSGGAIKLLRYKKGGAADDFPYENYPVHFPERPAKLVEIAVESQQILKGLNRNTLDEWEIKQVRPELCVPRHQVGGEPYLVQRNIDTEVECAICSQGMPFLASIADQAPEQMSFTGNDYVQVLAHYCKRCRVMGLYQQCD